VALRLVSADFIMQSCIFILKVALSLHGFNADLESIRIFSAWILVAQSCGDY
jgi:hypothetical protein